MNLSFDHFVYAARDLDAIKSEFEAMSGAAARIGGRHPGLGTRNALASLGGRTYLELMATDPEQAVAGSWAAPLLGFDTPRLYFYMLTGAPLEAMRDVLERHGVGCRIFDASRQTPEGTTLRWRLLLTESKPYGLLMPNAIDWLDSVHPATTSPAAGGFESFEMGHPDPDPLNAVLGELGAPLRAHRADRPCMRLKLSTPRGPLELNG